MEVEGAPKSFFALFTYQTFGASKKISLCVAQYHYRGAIISLARKREYNCGAVRDSNLIFKFAGEFESRVSLCPHGMQKDDIPDWVYKGFENGEERDSNLIPSLRLGGWFRGTLMGRKKPRRDISILGFLAYHEGFEPPTFWFVAKHSIRLS